MALKIREEIYLNPSEAGKKINRATQTVYQNWRKWGWRPFKFHQTLLFQESEIQSWLESQITELAV